MNTEINKHKKIAQSDEVHISNSKHCSRIEHTFKGIKLMMIVAQKKTKTKKQKQKQKKTKHGQISTIYLGNINPLKISIYNYTY